MAQLPRKWTGLFQWWGGNGEIGIADLENDTVVDSKPHPEEYKTYNLFFEDHYPYWKDKYPNLELNWGMFWGNLVIEGLFINPKLIVGPSGLAKILLAHIYLLNSEKTSAGLF